MIPTVTVAPSMTTVQRLVSYIKAFKPGEIVLYLNVILIKFIKVMFIYRVVRGFVILIGLITLLKWVGFDFSHVMYFFRDLPALANLQNTWAGEIYNAIFRAVLEVINGIAENAPEPPSGQKVIDAVKTTVQRSKNM